MGTEAVLIDHIAQYTIIAMVIFAAVCWAFSLVIYMFGKIIKWSAIIGAIGVAIYLSAKLYNKFFKKKV